ncbi:MAG: nitroreductase family protein [Bacteroidales bacterium]
MKSSVSLSIDQNTCIKCGKCVRICPVDIFVQESKSSIVNVGSVDRCISCGHCAGVCPTKSVIHSDFPEEKVHAIDYGQMPTPEQVMLLCKARRSNRAFSAKPVPKEYLSQIVEAAHRAPTASNKQGVRFLLVTDPEKVKYMSLFTLDVYNSALRKLQNPLLKPFLKRMMPGAYNYVPTFKSLQKQYDQGNDMIMRGATSVLIIYTHKKSRFGLIDSNLAYQNASLMAESLGVSQFYMGFVYMAIQQAGGEALAKSLGIDGTIHAAMAMGMPAFRFPNYIDKKEVDLKEI